MASLVVLRRSRVDRGLLFRAGARGCGRTAPRDCPLGPATGDLPGRVFSRKCSGRGISCGSSAITDGSTSSVRPTARRPGCTDGSLWWKATAPLPPSRPSRDFVALLRLVNGTLQCPQQEDPHPYRDLLGDLWEHLRYTLFPPWIIGRNSITAWEAHIVAAEWASECNWWCATTRASGTPTPPSHSRGGGHTPHRGPR